MVTKKDLHKLKHDFSPEFQQAFLQTGQKLNEAESKELMMAILKRISVDYQYMTFLDKIGCDINQSIEGYHLGDFLAHSGRLSPRLIKTMSDLGYDFTVKNTDGYHLGYYVANSLPISHKVIAALKAQGVDFSQKCTDRQSATDHIIQAIRENPHTSYFVIPLYETLAEAQATLNSKNIWTQIRERIKSIEPAQNENIGLHDLLDEIVTPIQQFRKLKQEGPAVSPQKIAHKTPLLPQNDGNTRAGK